MISRNVSGLILAAAIAQAGCSSAPSEQSDADSAGRFEAQLVYTLNLNEAHKIDFYEYGFGMTGTHETLPVGETEALQLPDDRPRSLSELFALANPGAEVPGALVLADTRAAAARALAEERLALEPDLLDRVVTERKAEELKSALVEDGAEVAKTSAAAITCSGDFFRDQWGAAWYVQNFGFGFSNGAVCPPAPRNVATFTDQGSITNAFMSTVRHSAGRILQWKQMEGDFTNRGSSNGTMVRAGTNAVTAHLWTESVAPRTISIHTMNPSAFRDQEWLATGTSPCSHLHRTIVWCTGS